VHLVVHVGPLLYKSLDECRPLFDVICSLAMVIIHLNDLKKESLILQTTPRSTLDGAIDVYFTTPHKLYRRCIGAILLFLEMLNKP